MTHDSVCPTDPVLLLCSVRKHDHRFIKNPGDCATSVAIGNKDNARESCLVFYVIVVYVRIE